jgi:TM2 domain
LRYAQALKRPILPVRIGAVDSVRVNPVSALQIIDYQSPSADTGIQLVTAVHTLRIKAGPLPEPLPDEPPVPFGYIMRLGNTLAEKELSPQLQLQLLVELRSGLDEDGDDPSARGDIAQLLRMLRLRHDVTYRTRSEIDNVLASIAPDEPMQPPPDVRAATPVDERESFPGPQWSQPVGQEQPSPVLPPPHEYSSYPGQPHPDPVADRGVQPQALYGGDPPTGKPLSDKKAVVAGVLQLFFGIFGVGRFYIGSKAIGGCQLGMTILGIVLAALDTSSEGSTLAGLGGFLWIGVFIWAIIDAIRMFTRSVTDGQGRKLR